MRKRYAPIAVAGLALLLVAGCEKRDRAEAGDAVRDAGRETADAMREVKEESRKAWNDVKDATWDRHADYRTSANREMNELQAELDRLGDKIKASTKEGSRDMQQEWQKLTDERSTLQRQVDRLGDATADGWDKTRDAVNNSVDKIQDGISDLKDKLD